MLNYKLIPHIPVYVICIHVDCQSKLCQGVHDRGKWYQQSPCCYQNISGNLTQFQQKLGVKRGLPSDKFVIPRTWRAERVRPPSVSNPVKNQNSTWGFCTGCLRNACPATPQSSCSSLPPSVSVQAMLSPIWPSATSCIQGITFRSAFLLECRR